MGVDGRSWCRWRRVETSRIFPLYFVWLIIVIRGEVGSGSFPVINRFFAFRFARWLFERRRRR